MKSLYYLETARSIDENNNPIPAKKMKWAPLNRVAYENPNRCFKDRIYLQQMLNKIAVRTNVMGWFKNISIRLHNYLNPNTHNWIIFKYD